MIDHILIVCQINTLVKSFPGANFQIDYQQKILNTICLASGDMSSYTSFAYMGGISAMLNDLAGLLNALPSRTLFHLTYDSSMSEVLGSLLLDQLTVKFKQYKLVCNGMKDSPISQMNQLFNCRALSAANRMIEPGKTRVVMTYHDSADANFTIHPFVSKAKSVAITLHKMIPSPWLLRMECPELDLWMHHDVPTIPWITPVESCYGFLHIVDIILGLKAVRELTRWAVPVNASFCLCLVMLQPKTFGDVTYVWKREFKHPRYAFIEKKGVHGWLLYRDEGNVKNRLLIFQLSNPSMVYFEALSSADAATLLTPISFYHHSHRY
ncbi:hypothetical protein WR25_04394 [Diploscapter pachys]|uniref:Uncharacterized protein n=1 Tax=Diploscapter pachys TaxID=2018661 RepID=A0A2A2KD43_9BILA|nr:hypothetical protein WR25_04394 [Diploscapter pachys]